MRLPKIQKGKFISAALIAGSFATMLICFVPGAFAESNACLECHDTYATSLDKTSHSPANKSVQISCTSCHVDYSKHVSEPAKGNITNPANLTAFDALNVCSQCHFGKSEKDFAHAGEHFKAGVNCAGCHKIHNAKANNTAALIKQNAVETCMNCHSKQKHQFALYSQHPVNSGAITCVDCHDQFSKLSDTGADKPTNKTCYNCHGEIDGPFVYEHEPTRDFGLEDGGCGNCHSPHGSPFARLLKEPSPQLCVQCHAVPPRHRTAHLGSYANVNCTECHTDIHGSDNNPQFLSMTITGSSSCYNNGTGCHPRH